MDFLLCGASALRFYRVPPQVLALYPPLPSTFEDPNHRKLAASALITDLLPTPIHRANFAPGWHSNTEFYKTRCFKNGLPPGSIYDTDYGFQVTSPAATLLTIADDVSQIQLTMVLDEMLGDFAVFNPCERTEQLLNDALAQRLIRPNDGWQRVINVNGQGTSLWKRSPLITQGELESFCKHASGFHGIKKLRFALEHAHDKTSSPFEVQASMLLSLPRSAGGEELSIKNNQRIKLTREAQNIYPHESCYADILIEGQSNNAGVIVECQGRSVHANEAAGLSDSNRSTALTSMGYEVILLTYEQLTNTKAFEAVLNIIARKTGIPRRAKTARQQAAEAALRQELFIPWPELGV